MQKFDVDPEYQGMYWHQYMGALASPSAEGRTAKRSYIDLGVLESYFVFKIPVYTSRPEKAAALPTDDINPNNYLSSIVLNNGEYTLDFNYATQSYAFGVPYECETIEISAQTVSSKATLQGIGTYLLKVGANEITLQVTAESGDVRDYTITIVRSEEIKKTVTVSGSVKSWDNAANIIVKLYNGEITDEIIRSDMETGTPTLALEYEATLGEITTSENQYITSFTLKSVKAGTYKLTIYKQGRYVVDVATITVGDENIEVENVDMWLYGDVNYDGQVNISDITQMTRYISLKTSVFDSGDEKTKANRLLAADVIGDDGVVNIQDITQFIRYISLKTSILDTIN